ncbi:ZBT40 protein, partial [Vidua macroura]|nr:ZBT40 protein [Vidua chalybeata]NXP97577.1 ZBT40 protein [Vidua macroura]
MYSGKLPLGKHNFMKENFTAITVAGSLQMFDVAVRCKNLLRDLISCSAQDQVAKGVSSQEADSSGNQAAANYLPQSGRPDEEKTFIILTQRVSPLPYRSRNGRKCFSSWPGTYRESYLGSSGHNVE